jgi:mannitol/fructose-specific phosphotransferase system IIA component (Ntr-type)/voltage-gated potassium channel Kch
MAPREALAVGFGMMGSGAMGIVLGLLALEAGVIRERMFLAIVIMAITTSALNGPLIQRALGRGRGFRLRDHLVPRGFVAELRATTREGAVRELALAVAPALPCDGEALATAAVERERLAPSGLAHGLAMPVARLDQVPGAVVAVGLSRTGIDFNAPDGGLAHIVCLVVTPGQDPAAQWGIMAEVSKRFASEEVRERVQQVTSFTELLAALNWGEQAEAAAGPRRGAVLVGAGPLARALARRLAGAGTPAWLVDMNRDHCLAAQREGLTAVQGDARRDVVLFQAHAVEAKVLACLTQNLEVNLRVAALGRDALGVPQAVVLTGPDEAAPYPRAVFETPAELLEWDRRVEQEATEWVTARVEQGGPIRAAAGEHDLDELLPLVVVRDGVALLAHGGLELRPGDEVHALRWRRPALSPPQRLALAVDRAIVLELEGDATQPDALARATAELTTRLGDEAVPPGAPTGVTSLSPWLSVGRLRLRRPGAFELVVARLRGPDGAAPPRALVVIASSEDEQRVHLEALAALAHRAQDDGAHAAWVAARDGGLAVQLFGAG